jgi:hypothetical protein
MQAVTSGAIFPALTPRSRLPADYFNLLTGYASLETLYRSLYYSKSLSREFGLPFDYATTTDVPSYTGAYPSVLASSGIKYWAVEGIAQQYIGASISLAGVRLDPSLPLAA